MFNFGLQTFCLLFNCFTTYPEVKVQHDGQPGRKILGSEQSYPLDITKPPLVLTNSGWVEGYFQKTILGRSVAAFEGIPYGQPPIGQLRFRNPLPNRPWTGTYKATKKAPACLQLDFAQLLRMHGQEDCLFLNVYTPLLPKPSDTKEFPGLPVIPVIVFLHGGGSISGRSSDYGPAYLLNRDVVFVTINYRLGVLGFLSTGDEHASGNWGLKDQLLAIKWVADNIKYFGGDHNRVTLMGVSAGAADVGLHIVSKRSIGLFHRGICESGSSLAQWAVQNATFHNSKKVASLMGCPMSSSESMMACLRTEQSLFSNWIVGRSMETWKMLLLSKLPFGATIEPSSPDAFLDEAPEVSYQLGRVKPIPMIVGIVKDEGSLFAASMYIVPGYIQQINRYWNTLIPYALSFEDRTNDTASVSKKIKDFYLKGEKMTFWNRKGWIQMFGDRVILQSVYHAMQYHPAVADTYGYIFNYEGNTSFISHIGLDKRDWGVSHADDQIYLMNSTTGFVPLTVGTKDYEVSQHLVNMWTNFATSGKPYYETRSGKIMDIWKPIDNVKDLRILEINETPKMIQFPQTLLTNLRFWQKLRLKDDHYKQF